jgi:CheY-like chemotaxis protein
VPALAISAYAREEDRMRALAAGFQFHVSKPFEPAAIVAAVARLAGRRPSKRARRSLTGAGAAQQTEASDNAVPSRVLIVEDDKDSREGLRELLQIWGHAVDVAQDGTEGIEKAVELQPGIALIDIGLPGLDGYQVAHRIREAFGQRPIFLVALTGYVDSRDRQRASESGFDAHLPKPINADKLNSLLLARERELPAVARD